MAERVAEIPEEAVKAGLDAFEWYDGPSDSDEDFRAAFGALLSALPSEWLLVRCFDAERLRDFLASLPDDHAANRDECVLCDLHGALSLLEQEAGGER